MRQEIVFDVFLLEFDKVVNEIKRRGGGGWVDGSEDSTKREKVINQARN